MKLIFDTSALSNLLAKDEQLLRAVSSQAWEQMIIPLAADGELRFGFSYGNKAEKNLKAYEDFIAEFKIEVACPDQNTSIHYADIAAWCRKKGMSLSQNDLWIAATAVQNAGKLITLDSDFEQLPQVSLVRL